jgi:hypothetical protein
MPLWSVQLHFQKEKKRKPPLFLLIVSPFAIQVLVPFCGNHGNTKQLASLLVHFKNKYIKTPPMRTSSLYHDMDTGSCAEA